MQDNIYNLLLMILMLENGGGTQSINQLMIMFLMMNSQNGDNFSSRSSSRRCGCGSCGRDNDFTF